jgi:hypothetical protein
MSLSLRLMACAFLILPPIAICIAILLPQGPKPPGSEGPGESNNNAPKANRPTIKEPPLASRPAGAMQVARSDSASFVVKRFGEPDEEYFATKLVVDVLTRGRKMVYRKAGVEIFIPNDGAVVEAWVGWRRVSVAQALAHASFAREEKGKSERNAPAVAENAESVLLVNSPEAKAKAALILSLQPQLDSIGIGTAESSHASSVGSRFFRLRSVAENIKTEATKDETGRWTVVATWDNRQQVAEGDSKSAAAKASMKSSGTTTKVMATFAEGPDGMALAKLSSVGSDLDAKHPPTEGHPLFGWWKLLTDKTP